MEHPTEGTHRHAKAHATPKDFFLWLGAIAALYSTITAFLALTFSYIDIAYPDPLAYAGDPFSSGTRVAMATIIVLVPVLLGTLLTIRRDLVRTPGKADIWVRKWALMLTIFLASATAAIDLITLINTFLGGEISIRFALKALMVLLISLLVALHFLADLRGYWTLHRRKVNIVGAAIGALAVMTIAAGFLVIGTPSHIRALRFDQQRVTDLQNIQYSITNYYQQKQKLPATLDALVDPLTGTVVPVDPQTNQAYEYRVNGLKFMLCATFATVSTDTKGQGAYRDASYQSGAYSDPAFTGQDAFDHSSGRYCFTRAVDPDKFPSITTGAKPL